MVVVDKYGLERKQGFIIRDDKLVVTAQDGITIKTYYLAMPSCKCGPWEWAYVISSVYSVNQVTLQLMGVRD